VKLLIAGGGTGGHLFPGIAMAEELTSRQAQNAVVFVGTARGLEAKAVPQAGYPLELIDVTGIKGKGILGVLRGLLRLPRALLQSMQLLRRQRPDVVLGVGGYASGPVLLAAWLLRIPTAIQEQNAVPGVTNRLLGHFVGAVFTAFPEAAHHFPRAKVHDLGNPIRRAMLENFLKPSGAGPCVDPSAFRLLVLGGSQGARRINEIVPRAVALLSSSLRARLCVTHQIGASVAAATVTAIREIYQQAGVRSEVLAFIEDMSQAYQEANLLICRAGASTLAELTVCHRASILIPFPFAADDHQTRNASVLVEAGAALMIPEGELDPARLAKEIERLAGDPQLLQRMEQAATHLGRPEAARDIVEVVSQLAHHLPQPGRPATPTHPREY
jgi:UDP-N-acetylglucosamine--N-acetylmuramyl-(pentapeptide) pyrophosphoryl-undecaprenol N-acetylglucosamine transferase